MGIEFLKPTTTVFLNEWTELEIRESKAELIRLIRAKTQEEKGIGKSDNFIEVTMIHTEQANNKNPLIDEMTDQDYIRKDIKIMLYTKRILFFYES